MERLDEEALGDLEVSARERLKAEEAISFEIRLLFGVTPEDDPSLAAMVAQRARLAALTRAFLALLEEAEPSSLEGLRERIHAWMTDNQRTLGMLTRQALERQVAQHDGDAVAAAEHLATVALVQAHAVVLTMGLEAAGGVLQAG